MSYLEIIFIWILILIAPAMKGQQLLLDPSWIEGSSEIVVEVWAIGMPSLLSSQASFAFDDNSFELISTNLTQDLDAWEWSMSNTTSGTVAWSAWRSNLIPDTLDSTLPLMTCVFQAIDVDVPQFDVWWSSGPITIEFVDGNFNPIQIDVLDGVVINPNFIDDSGEGDPPSDTTSVSTQAFIWMDSIAVNLDGHSEMNLSAYSISPLLGLQGSLTYDVNYIEIDSIHWSSVINTEALVSIDSINGVLSWSWFDPSLQGVVFDSIPFVTLYINNLVTDLNVWSPIGFSDQPTTCEAYDINYETVELDLQNGALFLCSDFCDSIPEDGEIPELYFHWSVVTDESIHISFVVDSFILELSSFQGTIEFDSNKLLFEDLLPGTDALDMNLAFGIETSDIGQLPFSWFTNTGVPLSMNPGDTLFSLHFTPLFGGDETSIALSNAVIPIEFIVSDFASAQVLIEDVSFILPPNLTGPEVLLSFEIEESTSTTLILQGLIDSSEPIAGFQGSVNFNPTQLSIVNISSNLDGFSEANYSLDPSSGTISFLWFSSSGAMPAGQSDLFQLSFEWNQQTDSTQIGWSSVPLEIEVVSNQLNSIPFEIQNLTVTQENSSTNELSLIGQFLSESTLEFELVSNQSMSLLACQGSIHWGYDANVMEISSEILPGFLMSNLTVESQQLGWSWFSSNLETIEINSGDPIFKGVLTFSSSPDSLMFSFLGDPIPIEFSDNNFQVIPISPIQSTFINDFIQESSCMADLDESGGVGSADLLLFLIEFGSSCDVDETSNYCIADLDESGEVGSADLLLFLIQYGTDCE